MKGNCASQVNWWKEGCVKLKSIQIDLTRKHLPAPSLLSFLLSVVVAFVTTFQALQPSQSILNEKEVAYQLSDYLLIRPCFGLCAAEKGEKIQFLFWKLLFFGAVVIFSKLRKVRVIKLPLGLLLWTSNPHFKYMTKSGSDKRHWREQQNSSTLLWLDCTNYRTGMNKRQ